MIKIRRPLCFTEIGRKDNQEDYLFPATADENTRVFIMCDGMGGHDNGEVASRTAAVALGSYLQGCKHVDIPIFETGLDVAYNALDNIDTNSSKKPGTTMTCLCLNEDNYLVAHIGDSRIYHIRPSLYNLETKRGGIIYQSEDHSLVNDLLKAGELTEEEAKDFPQKNIITRAMQPHLAKRYKADIYQFDDIKAGDYFFLCCDGVLEQLSNQDLCGILADSKISDKQKLNEIKSICDGKTKDNYTCWLIPVDKVRIETQNEVSSIIEADEVKEDEVASKIPDSENKEEKRGRTVTIKLPIPVFMIPKVSFSDRLFKWVIGVIVLLIIASGCCYAYKRFFPSRKVQTEQSRLSPKHKMEKDSKITVGKVGWLKPGQLNSERYFVH